MTKMAMNGIAFGVCMAGLTIVNIAQDKAMKKFEESFNGTYSEPKRPKDRWVKCKCSDVQ